MCFAVEEIELKPQVGQGHGFAGGGGNGSQVFTASMLTVFRLISLT